MIIEGKKKNVHNRGLGRTQQELENLKNQNRY
jgi:hypothetical protein